ncbi:heme exporter protein CcmB [Chloroflexi bacterium TSY]|nr:heme exporter protein CcmB [Chloroflexi bacterium TSY]
MTEHNDTEHNDIEHERVSFYTRWIDWLDRGGEFIRLVAFIAAKDLRSEARGRRILAVWGVFGLLIFVTFYVTLGLFQLDFLTVAPGVMWVIFALIGTLGLSQSYNQELESGGWHALLMSPINHSAIYFGKLASNVVVSLIAEIVVLICFSFVTRWPVDSLGTLLALVLGTIGFIGVGALAAAFVINKRGKELLLPMMVMPVVIPVIALAGQMMSLALRQPLSSEWGFIVTLLIGYDLVVVLAGAAAFSMISELY